MGFRKISLLPAVLGLMLSACLATTAWAADVVLIANSSIGASSLSKGDVKSIFLAKKKSVDGVNVKLATLKDDDISRQFFKAYVGKTPSQFSSYYKKLVFTGKGKPPKAMSSEADMIAYVARTIGAMGFVSAGAVTDAVKSIQVMD